MQVTIYIEKPVMVGPDKPAIPVHVHVHLHVYTVNFSSFDGSKPLKLMYNVYGDSKPLSLIQILKLLLCTVTYYMCFASFFLLHPECEAGYCG